MSATKERISDDARATTDRAIADCMAGYEVATARVFHLLEIAFEDGERAKKVYLELSHRRGTEEVIRILDDGNKNSRIWHFGFTNGALFARGDRHRTREALNELPEAIRERQAVSQKLGDLLQARRSMLEQADRERLEERTTREHQPARSRARD